MAPYCERLRTPYNRMGKREASYGSDQPDGLATESWTQKNICAKRCIDQVSSPIGVRYILDADTILMKAIAA